MDKTQKIKILTDLIKINSVNGNEIEVARYLRSLLKKYDIDAKIDAFGDKRANLIAEVGDKDSQNILGLTGHMDTVAVSEREWTYPPFSATIKGDRLYGRGSSDMKSGLAAQIIALIELKEADKLPKNGKVRLIITAGEEYGTPGANRLQKQNIAQDLSALLVGEPTGGNIIFAHSGSLNYEIKSKGKSFHSSKPEKGINAINGLVEFIKKEQTLFDAVPQDPYLGAVKHSVTLIQGGSQVNIIPSTASLKGNIRPTAVFDNDKVIERLQGLVDDINQNSPYNLALEVIQSFYPIATAPEDSFVQLAFKAAKNNFSDEIKLDIINGATDASVFTLKRKDLPVVVLGPDKWEQAHQSNEYTTISSYLKIIETYQEIIKNFFATREERKNEN
ncbi:ArgE/DapE family deacylase [Lactobacillus sp. PV037]|uniref:ArgE/DapE family deacylase n=1 Tax=unclassified Lactobacillus TaxID=2620435 RepID=UPI00224033FA|nr:MULTISPECIES: ArgE/DapE family deacylase [unclassified Lactobacillus]QNQ82250.1 ArgE/DapE family deacylase [Lactobacillus sp. PV012]QNQ83639.1 ArgE/DapE family deacylase [Lactobacillus sp. PV037]